MKNKVIFLQIVLTLLVVAGSLTLWGILVAISAGLGAVVAIVPNAIAFFLYFKLTHVDTPKQILRKFYVSELVKMIFTILLFISAFQWKDLIPLPFFISFLSFLFVHWIGLLFNH